MRRIALTAALVAGLGVFAAGASAAGPSVLPGELLGESPPVRELDREARADASGPYPRVNPLEGESAGDREAARPGDAPSDPLAARAATGSRAPAPGLVFDGVGNPEACGACIPPDPTGDVGPNHYVQMVNATKVAIFGKGGTAVVPPFELETLFPPGPCGANGDGDPQGLYDPVADRWLLSQFRRESNVGPFHLCFAISQTPDPAGTYFTYDFPTPEFPDYFKVGVWPSGYYVSANESTYTAYAFDRAKMLAGNPTASALRFVGQTNFLLPADLDGPRTPGATEGGFFYTFKDDTFTDHGGGADRIELFQLNPDFAAPASSTFQMIGSFPVTAFTYTVCGFFVLNCIPQGGTAQTVDPVSEWPMQRFVFRRFGDHDALVGNFTVGGGAADPGAAIRWFELRDTGAGWVLHQQGTHDPGAGLNRFMGSIAIDVEGNIALGYSASSSTEFPSLRYATRAPADPPGALGAEQVLRLGGGSQTGSNSGIPGDPTNNARWGDYSMMSVDPADDCTFWYTGEYYASSSTRNWRTAIGNFKEPNCADADRDGVANSTDACPNFADLTTPNGCPANSFAVGKTKINKKQGMAVISITVPGPGDLALKGKNLKSQRVVRAKPVPSAGTFKLKVFPKGKLKKKLERKGKAEATARITFTPTGGLPASQSKKVRLKKKR